MSYRRGLSSILKDRDPSLYHRLIGTEKSARGVLTYTAGAFPYYTPHDFSHSKNVEDNLNWLIPDELKPKLNAWEIFFLIVAAWLHDWGMVCQPGERPEDVREVHHIRTETNLEGMHNLVGLNQTEAAIVGRIARGHRKEDLRGDLFNDRIFSADIHIRIRFLSAVLRIADECDITANRVPELIYFSLNPQGTSKDHFEKHLSIGGIGKVGEHKIVFNAIARDPRGAKALRGLRDKIQKEVNHVKGILAQEGVLVEYVEDNIDARGFVDKPISFKLDETNVTQLLIGEALYSRKDVAIRELLQNAVDACKLRMSRNPDTVCQIRIYKQDNQLVIEDNGEGMNYDTSLNFLAKKGLSYYRSEEFKRSQKELNFDPISRWGLGFLSCLLIGSEIVVETQQEGRDACKFTISSVGEGWRYEELSQRAPGTKIILTLNDEGLQLDLEKAIRRYVKASTVAIFLGKANTMPMKFEWAFDDNEVQAYLQAYTTFLRKGFRIGKISGPIDYDDDEVWIRRYKVSGRIPSGLFLSNQGFYVQLFQSHRDLAVPTGEIVLVNLKKELLDLDVARERIRMDTPKFHEFREKWLKTWIGFLENDYKGQRNELPETLYPLAYFKILSYFRLEIDGYLSRIERVLGKEEAPKAYLNFVFCQVPNLTLTDAGLSARTLEQIFGQEPLTIKLYEVKVPSEFSYSWDETKALCTAEARFVESMLKDHLAKDELLIFCFSRGYGGSMRDRQETYDWLFARLFSKEMKVEHLTLENLLFNFKAEPAPTPLDSFLPLATTFVRMPPSLRRGVVCTTPMMVKVLDAEGIPKLSKFLYAISREIYKLPKLRNYDSFEIAKHATLALDLDDPFCKFLLENHSMIEGSSALRQHVTDYFALLAHGFIDPTNEHENFLELQERELEKIMGKNANVGSPRERRGEMTQMIAARLEEISLQENLTVTFVNAEGLTLSLEGLEETY